MNSQTTPRLLCFFLTGIQLLASSIRGQDDISNLKNRVMQVEQKLNEHLVETEATDSAEKLQEIVRQSFDARQALHRAQLQLLEKRVDLLRTDIKRRDTLAVQIIAKRVKELLLNESIGDPRAKNQPYGQPSSETQTADSPVVSLDVVSLDVASLDVASSDVAAHHAADPAQRSEYRVVYLEKIAAKDVYDILSEYAADWEGIRMARDDRLNSLLIQANNQDMQRLLEVIEFLDRRTDGSEEKTLPPNVAWPKDESFIKQYTVHGDRGRLLRGLSGLFQGHESAQVFPSGDQQIVVVGNEEAHVRSLSWLQEADSQVAYLVAIPSEFERKRRIASTDERLQQSASRRAELAEKFGPKHPSVISVLRQVEDLQKLRSELKKDHVIYNLYLAPGKHDTIKDVIGAVPKKVTVEWRIHPRGHLEIRGPRDDAVQYGDQLVDFMNRPDQTEEKVPESEHVSESESLSQLQLQKILSERYIKAMGKNPEHPATKAKAK